MNPLLPGVIVFVVFTSIVSGFMVFNLRKARANGLEGSAIIKQLLPFFLADAAFVLLFVFWLLNKL